MRQSLVKRSFLGGVVEGGLAGLTTFAVLLTGFDVVVASADADANATGSTIGPNVGPAVVVG